MALSKVRLGNYLESLKQKCGIAKLDPMEVSGVNRDKEFFEPSRQIGEDTTNYQNVPPKYFACNLMHVGRDKVLPIAYNHTNTVKHVSPAYSVFRIKENNVISELYFFLYLKSNERDRFFWFNTDSSIRDGMTWEDLCNVELELPDLPTQEKFVNVYLSMLENQKSYERGLEDLKLVCDGYIEDLRRKMPCKKIGPYISERREKNENGAISKALGISKEGFIDPKQDTGDLSNYWIFQRKDFVYSPPRINVGSIGLYDNDESCVCSPIYVVFYINDQQKILPEYLDMWLHRSEFLRSTDFYSLASVRNNFSFDLMSEVAIPIPSIGIQRSIVEIYSVYKARKQINEDLKEQTKNICPILIKGSIEEAR